MPTHNPQNERIKRRYFTFLREAHRQSVASVDAAAKALAAFETENRHRDFRSFHYEQAVAFKRGLRGKENTSGRKLSAATLATTLAHLKRFFVWLASQPSYRSRLSYSDAEYFNLSEKESRVASARLDRPGPTLEQVRYVISQMPENTITEKRDKAIVAFTLLTGARDGAVISFQLKHLNVARRCIEQDAKVVKTKYAKTFTTYFFPVGDDISAIVLNWVRTLRDDHLWGDEDPLFPATKIQVGDNGKFEVVGVARNSWANASPVRGIFRKAFVRAGLPYFNPHSVRKTLARLGEARCRTPEEFKAWSQNLGHEGVLTTFTSYGTVAGSRQAELMHDLADESGKAAGLDVVADAILRRLVERNYLPPSTAATDANGPHTRGT